MEQGEGEVQINKTELPVRQTEETASEYLDRLEGTEKFLFHGSPYDGIKVLEPREAEDIGGDEWGNDTAIYAVLAVVAVGRAILPKRETIKGNWSISSGSNSDESGGPVTTVSKNVVPGEGSVYIVDKQGFVPDNRNSEWKSKEEAKVLGEVKVNPEDYTTMGGRIVTQDKPEQF